MELHTELFAKFVAVVAQGGPRRSCEPATPGTAFPTKSLFPPAAVAGGEGLRRSGEPATPGTGLRAAKRSPAAAAQVSAPRGPRRSLPRAMFPPSRDALRARHVTAWCLSLSLASRARRHRATHARLSRTCASNGFAPARADGAFTVGSGAGISNGFDIRHPRAPARVAPAASSRASAPRIFPARPPSELARRSRPSTRRRVRMNAFDWTGMK